jgi:hypothetical protein
MFCTSNNQLKLLSDSADVRLWRSIHNTSFSLQLTNGSNNLEGYITLGWNSLPKSNGLTHWGHSQGTKKMKRCEYDP